MCGWLGGGGGGEVKSKYVSMTERAWILWLT